MIRKFVKLKKDNFYLLPSGGLVRINHIDPKKNKVLYYDYTSKVNDNVSFQAAESMMKPCWKIGPTSRMLGKKPSTLRKYELEGLIEAPPKYTLGYGKAPVRFYSEENILELIRFFRDRNPVGRPSSTNQNKGVDEETIKQRINSAYKEKKNG